MIFNIMLVILAQPINVRIMENWYGWQLMLSGHLMLYLNP